MNINNVCESGRLVRDAELAYTKTGFPVTSFTIAVDHNVKKGDGWEKEAYFFNVELFGKQGESLHDKGYLTKGKLVGVEGYLKQDRWKDKDTGENKSRIYICANNLELMQWGNGGNSASQEEALPDESTIQQTLPKDELIPF